MRASRRGGTRPPDALSRLSPSCSGGSQESLKKPLFQPNLAGCSVPPEVTDCCPKRTAARRTHGSTRTCHAATTTDREPGSGSSRWRRSPGVLVKASESRAVVRLDRPEREVEFADQEGQSRRFQSRGTHVTSWAATTLVGPSVLNPLKTRRTTCRRLESEGHEENQVPGEGACRPGEIDQAAKT